VALLDSSFPLALACTPVGLELRPLVSLEDLVCLLLLSLIRANLIDLSAVLLAHHVADVPDPREYVALVEPHIDL